MLKTKELLLSLSWPGSKLDAIEFGSTSAEALKASQLHTPSEHSTRLPFHSASLSIPFHLHSKSSNLSNARSPSCLANLAVVPRHPGLQQLLLVLRFRLRHLKPVQPALQPVHLLRPPSRLLPRQAKAQVSLARWLRRQRMSAPILLVPAPSFRFSHGKSLTILL